MRLDQDTKEYRQMEIEGDYEGCWKMLTNTLNKYAVPPARARRRAQAMWNDLAWPQDGGGIKAFHTSLRQALMACDRQHVAKAEHDVVKTYLGRIPPQNAPFTLGTLCAPQKNRE